MLSRQGSQTVFRVEISSRFFQREKNLILQIQNMGITVKENPKITDLYFILGDITQNDAEHIATALISDPVTESCQVIKQKSDRVEIVNGHNIVEVALRPGVTDNIANQLLLASSRLEIQGIQAISTGQRYELPADLSPDEVASITRNLLTNDTIQRYAIGEIMPEFVQDTPQVTRPEVLALLSATPAELQAINQERRLALSLDELQTIQAYFKGVGRNPTDAEVETVAQTWSEHCIHKTFKATVNLDDGTQIKSIIGTYLKSATNAINAPWVRSAFVDNAGVIEFDDEYDISFKVETHNHPSAIEPFGGANTGVGGVVRDILGVSHRPIANTNILCFGPQELDYAALPPGVLHPAQIQEGVVAGVGDYGNKLGIPTVNGAILYHPGYTANPLVYCGCVGIGPRDSHPQDPQPGDRVIVLGGRTGRDGIRGATFSSLTMDAQTGEVAGASVQIGDPITEKGLLEVIEIARNRRLYTAVTDCGAGGLSSAIGEMGAETGVEVDLGKVTTKYQGLAPWEIWLSEAQERMVLAVPPGNISALEKICAEYWVEISDVGVFTDTHHLLVTMDANPVVDIEMEFLHHGISLLTLEAVLPPKRETTPEKTELPAAPIQFNQLLLDLLRHPNIASKEETVRKYDHEVRGGTLVRPFTGPRMDGPSDAAVVKPLGTKGTKGFALANGINPTLSEQDAYQMAMSVVDEAVRNIVCVGGDPAKTALLDNFCWGNPKRPEIMGTLVEAARGCHDAAILFQAPFISGKDSLNNEYLGNDGERHAIPGTLLISSIAIVPDVANTVTMDLKHAGNFLYLVGDWQPGLLGSHTLLVLDENQAGAFADTPAFTQMPTVSALAPEIYKQFHQAVLGGLVEAAHDLSEGGLGVAVAEMSLAARMGAVILTETVSDQASLACFAESNNCIIAEVAPKNAGTFEAFLEGHPCVRIGEVTGSQELIFRSQGDLFIQINVEELARAFTNQGEKHNGNH